MRTAVVVPTAGGEHFLTPAIAGVSVEERLRRTARKADAGVFFWAGERKEGLERRLAEGRSIVLRPGFLPDASFLESLIAATAEPGSYRVEGEPSVFVIQRGEEGHRTPWTSAPGRTFAELAAQVAGASEKGSVRAPAGALHDVRTEPQRRDLENRLFRSVIKDTEGFMSRHFERKISIALSRRLVWTAITPNQMSLVSIAIGLVGALFMGIGGTSWQVSGALLFLAHSILDGCDGEIARVKLEQSRLGGLIDFWGDNVVHTAVFGAVAVEWFGRTRNPWALGFGALAVGGSLGSAALVYASTMRDRTGEGPLYESVSSREDKGRVLEVADFLSRRDFIYLVVLLSLVGRLDWFLVLSGVGAPVFFLVLAGTWLRDRMRARARPGATSFRPRTQRHAEHRRMPK